MIFAGPGPASHAAIPTTPAQIVDAGPGLFALAAYVFLAVADLVLWYRALKWARARDRMDRDLDILKEYEWDLPR